MHPYYHLNSSENKKEKANMERDAMAPRINPHPNLILACWPRARSPSVDEFAAPQVGPLVLVATPAVAPSRASPRLDFHLPSLHQAAPSSPPCSSFPGAPPLAGDGHGRAAWLNPLPFDRLHFLL